jgi:hypothetical protein
VIKTKKKIDMFHFVLGGDDAAGFAPSFIEKPKIIPNDTGTLITMRCKCKAKPKPIVTWYRGTTVVKETSKIKIKTFDKDEDTYELLLEIKVRLSCGIPLEVWSYISSHHQAGWYNANLLDQG